MRTFSGSVFQLLAMKMQRLRPAVAVGITSGDG